MPDGPLLLSPDRSIKSLHREIIRQADKFKIDCLKAVKNLFPSPTHPLPFHAGFGNRETDTRSYQAVLVPDDTIFITNPKGQINKKGKDDFISYKLINQNMMDQIFPVIQIQNEPIAHHQNQDE